MRLLGGLVEISTTSIKQYPGDTSGNSIVATLEGSAGKGETAQVHGVNGIISNPPKKAKGFRIRVGSIDILLSSINYGVEIPSNQGETKVYSTDEEGAEQASHYLDKDGNHIFNNGSDYAVSHTDLQTALSNFATAVNIALAAKLDGGGTNPGLTLDISSSKVEEVKLP